MEWTGYHINCKLQNNLDTIALQIVKCIASHDARRYWFTHLDSFNISLIMIH